MRLSSSLTVAFSLALGLTSAVAVSLAGERDAQACGGCFHDPGENNTVVTDHRMVLAVTPAKTTLYDQIRYQGNPGSFAWVLPIRGEAQIGISSDAVFAALDAQTSVQVFAPPTNCPPRPSSCDSDRALSGEANASPTSADGVQVLKQETVGPYETVQLRATDPTALATWLAANKFVIPDTIAPVVSAYIAEKYDFLALRLIPGKGIQSMRPVRVTSPGANPQLPLRMIAAGTGPNVGIGLWVIGAGRWEPQNFPSFTVAAAELSWDWASSSSNFKQVRAEKAGKLGAGAFEQESSLEIFPSTLVQQIAQTAGNGSFASPSSGGDGLQNSLADYQDQRDDKGVLVQTARKVFEADMESLVGYNPNGRGSERALRVTRMRADLPQASLASDLVLQASADQEVLARGRQVTREIGEPNCPVFAGCTASGTAPRSAAYARTSACAVSAPSTGAYGSLGAVCMGLGLIAVAARRRRRN